MNIKKEEDEGIKGLVKMGSEITGPALGAAIGWMLGGPGGAAAGGASGPLLTRGMIEIGNDISERFLSDREKIRIGGVIIYASHKIQEKLAAGDTLRADDFFQKTEMTLPACAEISLVDRPSSEEIIEGVLLAAQRGHEEKKLPFLGNLLANIAFEPIIDRAQANLLIKIGKDLSFRQLCLLKIFKESERYDLKKGDYRIFASKPCHINMVALLDEIFDLVQQGLLYCGNAMCSLHINPHETKVEGFGITLYELLVCV